MRTIQLVQEAGADKTLQLTIPVDRAGWRYEVVIVVAPEPESSQPPTPEQRGWPAGFFEQTAGAWQGEFVRESEGPFEEREPL
jgi:hypothetical protein